ncbi:unnamed protein product [Oppiella nova]|uniref:Uncharacterized protein n=1 Tax=Oppiella nova TaxID=334625 RepID=A0A7R9QUY8_9ACAR|nr:unnamed protein product [Oppiella nova]CAG2175297.1 unnamed protein product [Oppiella nova]
MNEYRECSVCGANNRDNPDIRLGENYVRKGSGTYTCEKDRQFFIKNINLKSKKKCQGQDIGPNDEENHNIKDCGPCRLHKCIRIGMRQKHKPQDMPQNSSTHTKRQRNNTTDTSAFDLMKWPSNSLGNGQGHSATINGFNRHPTQSFPPSLNADTHNNFEETQLSKCNDQVYDNQYKSNLIANNGYNFGANSTGNRNNSMNTSFNQPNLTHTSEAQTGWPYTEPLTLSYGTSISVNSFESTSSPLVTDTINTDNNVIYPVFQDLVDLESPTNEGTVGQELEYTYINGALPQQQPQQSANTSTAVESYETGLASQPNVYNNIIVNQSNDLHNNIVYDMIHTLINKINLGFENKAKLMTKEIVDELMQKGPGRFKQLLDTAGLHREAEAVVKMFIMKEPWECTTDVELNMIKAPKLRSGDSRYFQMNSHPRGRAIIFAATDGLDVEILRWRSIFAQLDFKCEVYADSTCSEIKDKLLGVSCQRFVADALFVMVIGGGYDEKVCGFGDRRDNEMSFTEIVDIFSANNVKSDVSLRMKPKIFVFNTFSIVKNTWRYPNESITLFGQAFSYSIAQYACNYHLTNLVGKTVKRLTDEHGENHPQIILNSVDMTRDIYFNPDNNVKQ